MESSVLFVLFALGIFKVPSKPGSLGIRPLDGSNEMERTKPHVMVGTLRFERRGVREGRQ